MKRSWNSLLSAGALLCLVQEARAGINVNNGNFYVAYTDLYVPTKGINLEFTRTYNSRSNFVRGYFGVGWASDIEGYLKFDKDRASFFEGGGGNVSQFSPTAKGQWESQSFGPQKLKKTPAGYYLTGVTGKEYAFDDTGRLLKILDKNNNYLELVWDKNRPSMVRDNLNNQVRLKWGEFGKISRIVALEFGDQKARFEYNPKGDLVKASGADAIPYEYDYDDEHNLVKISYKDGTYKEMAYIKARDWVTKFRDVDGTTAQYEYIADPIDSENKFGTTLTRTVSGAGEKEISKFWYEFKRRADGTRYNQKAVSLIGNTITETLFTECCGTPQVISQWNATSEAKKAADQSWIAAAPNKKTTAFEYYTDGLLKKKTSADGVVTQLAYDKVHKKVSKVVKNGRSVEYNYDNRGNLAWAFDSAERRRLDLTYDVNGRLTVVHEKKIVGNKEQKLDVFFRYNAKGQPNEVKERSAFGEGVIKINYDERGEVLAVLDGRGRSLSSEKDVLTAQRVAGTFQNLLEIVQPAGVSLTPEG